MADKDFELDPEELKRIEEEALKSIGDEFELDEETLKQIEAEALRELAAESGSAPAAAPAEPPPKPEPPPAPKAEPPPPPPPPPKPEPAAKPATVDTPMMVTPKRPAAAEKAPEPEAPKPVPAAPAPEAPKVEAPPPAAPKAPEAPKVEAPAPAAPKAPEPPKAADVAGGEAKPTATGTRKKVVRKKGTVNAAALSTLQRNPSLAVAEATMAKSESRKFKLIIMACVVVLAVAAGAVAYLASKGHAPVEQKPSPEQEAKKQELAEAKAREARRAEEFNRLMRSLKDVQARQDKPELMIEWLKNVALFLQQYPEEQYPSLRRAAAGIQSNLKAMAADYGIDPATIPEMPPLPGEAPKPPAMPGDAVPPAPPADAPPPM